MFQCQSGYTLRKIKDTCYLLPYGQQIADQRKGMVLNDKRKDFNYESTLSKHLPSPCFMAIFMVLDLCLLS